MKAIDILKSFGLLPIGEHSKPFTYNTDDYDLSGGENKEKIIEHRDFLKSVLEEENGRLGYIENKTSQIISQTSIVFSLLGLFIPLIVEKSNNAVLPVKILLVFLVLLSFCLYLLSITNALKNFNVKRFRYAVPDPGDVINFKDKTSEEFNADLVRSYLYSINHNIAVNNEKATNLLHAHKAFKFGNITTGILVVCTCFILMFTTSESSEVNQVEIKNFNEIQKNMKPVIIYQRDTLMLVDTIFVEGKGSRKRNNTR